MPNNWAKKLRRKNLKIVSAMLNGFSFNSYCYFWWTHKHASFITKVLWNWPADQKQTGASRHWATLNNIPAGKLHLGDCLSPWPVFSSIFLTDGCRFCRPTMFCYVRHKQHLSGINNVVNTPEKHSSTPEMKYGRNNVCFLFSDTACVLIPRLTLLSDRGHLQHTGSIPGEKKSVETMCIEALIFYISQCRTEVVKQQAGFFALRAWSLDVFLSNLLFLVINYSFSQLGMLDTQIMVHAASIQPDTEQALEKAHTAHWIENVLDELHIMLCTECTFALGGIGLRATCSSGRWPCPWQEGWNWMSSKVFSNLNHSMISWIYS